MAIDKAPAVGRIVVPESWLHDGFFRKGGPIVKVTAQSVTFNGDEGRTQTIRKRSIAAVCDSIEEEDRLVAFGRRALREIGTLREKLRSEAQELFTK